MTKKLIWEKDCNGNLILWLPKRNTVNCYNGKLRWNRRKLQEQRNKLEKKII